jgi:predicted DNA binding protein
MTPAEKKRHAEGEQIFTDTGRMLKNKKTGEYDRIAKQDSTKMAEAFISGKGPKSLISEANTPIENIYAEYAAKTKALANAARKELYSTGRLKLNASAKKVFAEERASLISKLNLAKKNAPLERQAQLISNWKARARIEAAGLDWKKDKDDIKKIKQQELRRARESVGTKSRNPKSKNSLSIQITDREWQAIQAGAISDTTLTEIIKYCDMDALRERATPKKQRKAMSAGAKSRARSLLRRGYSQAEVADEFGISVTTLLNELDI